MARVFGEAAALGVLHQTTGGEPLARPDAGTAGQSRRLAGLYVNLIIVRGISLAKRGWKRWQSLRPGSSTAQLPGFRTATGG